MHATNSGSTASPRPVRRAPFLLFLFPVRSRTSLFSRNELAEKCQSDNGSLILA